MMKPSSHPKKQPPLMVQGTSSTYYREPKPSCSNAQKRPTTSTMKRSGSIGNLPRATIPPQQSKVTNAGCGCSQSNETLAISQELLREQYARSLEQQIQLLELENNYLKQKKEPGNSKVVNIMSRGNELSINGKEWCKLPSFHPPLDKILGERINQAVNAGSSFKLNKEQSFDTSISNLPSRDLTRVIASDSRMLTTQSPEGHLSFRTVKAVSPDTQLLHELEDKVREAEDLKVQIMEQHEVIRKREERINQLSVRLREAESDLSTRSEADTRDKRALMEEGLELQRRLDDLTPILAEKEARIARVEDEKEALVMKTRSLSSEIGDLKLKLSERVRQDELQVEKEKSSKAEVLRLKTQIDRLNSEINENQKRDDELQDEISGLKRRIKEVQLHHKNDQQHIDQLKKENTKLISENSRLTTDMAKVEYNMEKIKQESYRTSHKSFNEEEIIELRLSVKAHLTQINILEERLKAAQTRNEVLEKEMDSRATSDGDLRNERSRIQKELEALQALSRSLSTENKALREEKMALSEKVEAQKSKLASRDIQIRNLEDEITERDIRDAENLQSLEKDSQTQGQRAIELEELSRRVRELSESFTSETRRPRPRTSILQKAIPEETESEVYRCSIMKSTSKINEKNTIEA